MSDTTKTPRAHADLAIKFYSDSKMKCWYWSEKSQTWDAYQMADAMLIVRSAREKGAA